MLNKPTIFIVCGAHDERENVKQLLNCITKQSYRFIQTILVDDGSKDKTSEFVKNKFPDVEILSGDGNLWWTGSIHWGIEKALKSAKTGDFILTVNSDCIVEKDFVSILVNTSIEQDRAIVGSLILGANNDSTIYDAGIQIDWTKGKLIPLGPKNIKDLPKDRKIQQHIDTLTTKGTIYPVEVFSKIGNFDKKHLRHYLSDYEFACRAKRAGFKLCLAYDAKVYNDIARTGFGTDIMQRFDVRKLTSILFSRKSKINIPDHFWFITLCCPPRYKVKNYFLLAGKFFYLSRVSFLSLWRKK